MPHVCLLNSCLSRPRRQISLCQDPRGADQLGRSPGVITLALKNLQHEQGEYREMWLSIIRRESGWSAPGSLRTHSYHKMH